MSHCEMIKPGALVTFVDLTAICPYCGQDEHDAESTFEKPVPKRGYYRRACRDCLEVYGITSDMTGDVVTFRF